MGDSLADIESVKSVSDIYSPVSGKVVEVNEALLDRPELVNEAPYDQWLFKIEEVGDIQENLLRKEAYENLIARGGIRMSKGKYVSHTEAERQEMLKTIGVEKLEDLYQDVPVEMKETSLNLPDGQSELEVSQAISKLAEQNHVFHDVYRGAGAYRHYIPALVRQIASKEEFLTAYTPYRAEISQGVLQSIFEFQTMICELTGMDVANASVYDGATAASRSNEYGC